MITKMDMYRIVWMSFGYERPTLYRDSYKILL